MTWRTPLAAALATVAALVPAGVAAADATVHAVDGTAENPVNTWNPRDVTIKAGETVTWTFPDSDGFHNVASDSPNWTLTSPITTRHPPVSHRFADPGIYKFVCEAHRGTMEGTVTVTDAAGTPPPPPPPPPLSEQPFPNDQSTPAFDVRRPAVTRLRATARRRTARVRFRLSEAARVIVKVKRGPLTVARRAVNRRRGTHRVTIRGLQAARYRIEVRATDLAGNRSQVRRTRVRIR